VNDFSTLGSTQDSVEGVYLVLELIGRAQQVGGRCVGEAQPGKASEERRLATGWSNG